MSWTSQHRRIPPAACAALAAALFWPALSAAATQAPVPSHDRTPAGVYRSACQGCHGPDGRGIPQSITALPLPVPDFTDCNFATREPDGDWLAIIHDGGPARAFDPLMPAFGEALTEEEMALALAHVRTFCGGPEGVAARRPEPAAHALHREGVRRRRGGRHGVDRRGRRPGRREQARLREAVLLEGPVRARRAARLQAA